MRVFKWTSLSVLAFCWVHFSYGQNKDVLWGTHGGLNSPNYWFTGTAWTSSPSTEQLLKDFAGNPLTATGHTSNTNDFDGDLIELGFFASALGTSGNIGGTVGEADTPSTNLFEGTWIPLTTKTYIGQDWGTVNTANIASEIAKETVDAGEFEFKSSFTQSGGNWNDFVNHNNDEGEGYTANADHDIIGASGDNQAILSDHLDALTSGTKLGIRFYDSNGKNNGTTSYNTIMNDSWTWGGSGAQVEMFLHKQSSPNDLADGLKFEFDNSDYASVSDKAGSSVNLRTSDFVTTITYWTGLSNLSMTGSNQDTVLSGVDGTANITGGNDNKLTLNVNGEGTTSNAYSFSGDIVDNGSGNGGLEVIKTGTGTQTLTGNITLDDDADSFLNIHQGTLTLATASSKTHSVEYLKGQAGTTLELANGDSDLITLGFGNTNGGDSVGSETFDYSVADFAGTVLISGNVAHTIKVGSGTTSGYYEDEQTLSGSLSTSGTDTLVKDGVGRLRLTGDSSSNYDNLITVNNGTLVLGDAGNTNNVNFDTTGPDVTQFRIEKGKLEIAAGDTITNIVQGSATSSNNTKSMVGGDGTLNTVTIGSADNEIDTISPGQGIASSLSSTSSQQQVSLGNGNAASSIGTFNVGTLNLNAGGVYDWEITDFDGSAGTGWDLLKYDTLNYNPSDSFTINIFSINSDGDGGASSGNTWSTNFDNSSAYGFKFMEYSGSGGSQWGGSNGALNNFSVNAVGWQYYNHHFNDWGVYHHNGSFYLQYSAVPEPSTYVMVTGLLMLPGYNFVRRMRKKKSLSKGEDEEIIS